MAVDGEKICKLCGQETDSLCEITEQWILKIIILGHPEWVEEDGACPKCTEYYESLTDNLEIIQLDAGGLEFTTRRGDKLGKRKKAIISLVGCTLIYLWKHLVHEVAAVAPHYYP